MHAWVAVRMHTHSYKHTCAIDYTFPMILCMFGWLLACAHILSNTHTRTIDHTFPMISCMLGLLLACTHSHTHTCAIDCTFPMISRMLGWLLLVEVASAFKGTTQQQPIQHACLELFTLSWRREDMQSLFVCLLSVIKAARGRQTLCQYGVLHRSWVLFWYYVHWYGEEVVWFIYCKMSMLQVGQCSLHCHGTAVRIPATFGDLISLKTQKLLHAKGSCLGDLCVCIVVCIYYISKLWAFCTNKMNWMNHFLVFFDVGILLCNVVGQCPLSARSVCSPQMVWVCVCVQFNLLAFWFLHYFTWQSDYVPHISIGTCS